MRRARVVSALLVFAVTSSGANSLLAPVRASAATANGTYHPLVPYRLLDTRSGAPLRTGGTLSVAVARVDGVPAGATAAVINLTVTDTTSSGYLTLWPTGTSQPLASNLNFVAGQTAANLAEVTLGGGSVSVYNFAGNAHVVMDLEGYVAPDAQGSLFNPLQPVRLLDTRDGTGAPQGAIGPGGVLGLKVTGRGGIPSSGVAAVVLNLTEASNTRAGYVTAYPSGNPLPTTSNLNFAASEVRPNRVIVGVGADGLVDLYNFAGNVDLVADASGWFASPGGAGGQFNGLDPARILDSRDGTGGQGWKWGPRGTFPVQVAGRGGVPAMGGTSPPTAVVADVTVTDTTSSSYLTAWPQGAPQPLASDLNYLPGEVIANLVVVPLSATGQIDLYNFLGCSHVVMDVVGYYTGPAFTSGGAPAPAADPCVPLPSAGWLTYMTYYRATAGEGPVTEDPALSQGDADHAHYTVANGILCHCEDPSKPYYTADGDSAAQHSDLAAANVLQSPYDLIDGWMTGPFHAAGIIDPSLRGTGFGSYYDPGSTSGFTSAGGLNVLSETNTNYPDPYPTAVEWPGPGMTVPVSVYPGFESPSPLASCPGYGTPTGLPVDLMVGYAQVTVRSSSFLDNGAAVPFCEVDQNNAADSFSRLVLSGRGQVILIPHAPLHPGHLYTASVTVQVQANGGPTSTSTDTWSFWVAGTRDE